MRLLFAILAATALLQQQPEPPEFPAGHFCVRPDMVRTSKHHPCHCRDNDDCAKPEEGQGQGPRENSACKQYCHKDHCSCKPDCQ